MDGVIKLKMERQYTAKSEQLQSISRDGKVSRYIKDGSCIYRSETLHHQKDRVCGYLYKMAEEVKFFSIGLYYKRYFILSSASKDLLIQDGEISKKVKRVKLNTLMYIDNVQNHSIKKQNISCQWKYSFALNTAERKYFLFARNEEEQYLWLTAFYRICNVQVCDTKYTVPIAIQELYTPRKTGEKYRIKDPTSSSRDASDRHRDSTSRSNLKNAALSNVKIEAGTDQPNSATADRLAGYPSPVTVPRPTATGRRAESTGRKIQSNKTPGSETIRTSQLSSVRVVRESEFEEVFEDFKRSQIPENFKQVYDQVLSTVVKAHERNKTQKQETLKNFDQLEEKRNKVEEMTEDFTKQKQELVEEITRRRQAIQKLDQHLVEVEQKSKKAIQQRHQRAVLKKVKLELEGTAALGPVDRPEDGTTTRRERRKVIVLRQERGQSLELTLQNSRELTDLGMAFDSFKVQSPLNQVVSPKNRKIILRKVEKNTSDRNDFAAPMRATQPIPSSLLAFTSADKVAAQSTENQNILKKSIQRRLDNNLQLHQEISESTARNNSNRSPPNLQHFYKQESDKTKQWNQTPVSVNNSDLDAVQPMATFSPLSDSSRKQSVRDSRLTRPNANLESVLEQISGSSDPLHDSSKSERGNAKAKLRINPSSKNVPLQIEQFGNIQMPTTAGNGHKNFKFPMSPVTAATSGNVGNQATNTHTQQTFGDQFTNTEEQSAMQSRQTNHKFKFPNAQTDQDLADIDDFDIDDTKVEILGAGGKYEKKVTKPEDHQLDSGPRRATEILEEFEYGDY